MILQRVRVHPGNQRGIELHRGRDHERLREAAGLVSGTSGCDPESFIISFGQSGLRPELPGAFGQNL